MLEYTKLILEKVSFDVRLFHRELRKASHNLSQEEFDRLQSWCNDRYGSEYCLPNEYQKNAS